MTDLHRNSKPDTVYLGDAAGDGIEVDASERRTDLVIAGGVASESPSARAAVGYPRELAVVLQMSAGDDGVVLYHGDPGGSPDYSYRMSLTFAGKLQCAESGLLRVEVDVPGLAAVQRTVLLHWSSRREGASVKTEAMAYNLDSGEVNVARASHTEGTTDPLWDLVVGGGAAADDPFVGGLSAFVAVRVSRRFHTTTEAVEDWVAETSPPSMEAIRRRCVLEFDRNDITLPEHGEMAGPAYLWAGAAARDGDRRCSSPLLNLRIPPTEAYELTFTPTPENWIRVSPYDDDFVVALPHVWKRPVPPSGGTWARVRIFVRQILDGGDDTAGPVYYRMLSSSKQPNLSADLGMSVTASEAVHCEERHEAAEEGVWLDLGDLRLQVDDHTGETWLMLSWKFGEGDEAEDTVAQVLAVTVDPFSKHLQDGLDLTI